VILLIIFGFLIQTLIAGWEQVRGFEWQLDLSRLGVAMLMLVFFFIGQSLIWVWSVRKLGIDLPWRGGVTMYMTSQLAKYVPGGIWSFANVAVTARQAGLSASLVTLMFVLNTLLVLWSAALCSLPALLTLLPDFPLDPGVLLGLLLILSVALVPFLLRWGLQIFIHWRHLPEHPEINQLTSFRTVLLLLIGMLGLHLVACLAFYLYFSALVPVSLGEGLFAASAWSASWFAGFAILVVPSGIGVREGILTLLLGSIISPSVATALALGYRVFMTIFDSFVLFGLFINQLSKSQ
jgi:uncharacterized membrane protein YbhN (UPF0104 family)